MLTSEQTKLELPAHVSPLREQSFITPQLAQNLQEEGLITPISNEDNERFHIKFSLQDKKIQTTLSLMMQPIYEEDGTEVSVLLGRQALQGFDESPLGQLLERKRQELLLRTDLIEHRGDAPAYTAVSTDLFGSVSSGTLRSAAATLHNRAKHVIKKDEAEHLNATQATEQFNAALEQYGLRDWKVVISDHVVARCTVTSQKMLVRHDATFTQKAVDALIAHEIETHILCAENAQHQPYHILQKGTAGYLETQEGLASFSQNRIYTPEDDAYYSGAINTLGLQFALEHSFAQTVEFLIDELEIPP